MGCTGLSSKGLRRRQEAYEVTDRGNPSDSDVVDSEPHLTEWSQLSPTVILSLAIGLKWLLPVGRI